MTAARLLLDDPASGAWNMAVDEALLESAQQGVVTFRFYHWTPATLSLGYFQSAADRERHAASLDCPVVRRSTGGGAIVHDRELTYSLAIPCRERFSSAAEKVYDAVHDALVETLAHWEIAAQRCEASRLDLEDRFLCFERRSKGDVLCGGWKIAGSAQRRQGGALVQHGSLLLAASQAAPELPGIQELTGCEVPMREFQTAWFKQIAEHLGLTGVIGSLNGDEWAVVGRLIDNKYSPKGWILRR